MPMVNINKFSIPKVFAHRGASGIAPENTLAAISLAADLGAKAIELDVNISSDGVAIIMHDESVDRCTNASGLISDITFAQLQKLDAGSWFAEKFSDEKIPTLKQAMDLISGRGLYFNLEIKPSPGREAETAEIIANEIKVNWQENDPILVSSISEIALKVFNKIIPHISLGLIVRDVPKNWHEKLSGNNCISIHFEYSFANTHIINEIKSAGFFALAYTVDDPEMVKKLFAMGIDGIFTNNPKLLTGSNNG